MTTSKEKKIMFSLLAFVLVTIAIVAFLVVVSIPLWNKNNFTVNASGATTDVMTPFTVTTSDATVDVPLSIGSMSGSGLYTANVALHVWNNQEIAFFTSEIAVTRQFTGQAQLVSVLTLSESHSSSTFKIDVRVANQNVWIVAKNASGLLTSYSAFASVSGSLISVEQPE